VLLSLPLHIIVWLAPAPASSIDTQVMLDCALLCCCSYQSLLSCNPCLHMTKPGKPLLLQV
jgi:hypothetical protein